MKSGWPPRPVADPGPPAGERQLQLLHVITGLMTGGAERALVRLAATLQGLGVVSSVIALRDGPIRAELSRIGISTQVASPLWPHKVWSLFRRLGHRPASAQTTVIQGWMYHGNLFALALGWYLGVPVCWGVRQAVGDGRHDRPMTRITIWICARLSRTAEAVVFNSAEGKRQHLAIGFDPRRCHVIANGFDTERFFPDPGARAAVRRELGIPGSSFVIGHVARYHTVKNHSMFVRAAAQVLSLGLDAHVVMAGRQVDCSDCQLTHEINATGQAARFHRLGERHDLERLLCGLDVLCLTSWSESLPNVIGEAMSCGVPCISTDVGDVATLIGDAGFLVPVNAPEAMAAAILQLAQQSRASRAELSSRCRELIVQKFSMEAEAEAYQSLYRSLKGPQRKGAQVLAGEET